MRESGGDSLRSPRPLAAPPPNPLRAVAGEAAVGALFLSLLWVLLLLLLLPVFVVLEVPSVSTPSTDRKKIGSGEGRERGGRVSISCVNQVRDGEAKRYIHRGRSARTYLRTFNGEKDDYCCCLCYPMRNKKSDEYLTCTCKLEACAS